MIPTMIIATGAYGRTYQTSEEVLADWNKGEDFRNETDGIRGTYFSKRTEFPPEVKFIEIRFNRGLDIVVINAATGVEHHGE